MSERILRCTMSVGGMLLSLALACQRPTTPAGEELLYNGLPRAQTWPPLIPEGTSEPMPVPYLDDPPAVIPIDVGRQLFVDDFLVDETTLQRTFHQARYHPANPILRPEESWEKEGGTPTAMVFSDGVWYDPEDGLFKMWYMCGYTEATCYATSRDGVEWEKPLLDVVPETNIVLPERRDSNTVWLDLQEQDPQKRFKLFTSTRSPKGYWEFVLRCSPDGIHWSEAVGDSARVGDPRCSAFYNPFRQVWVFSRRPDHGQDQIPRVRYYSEHANPERLLRWDFGRHFWVGADQLDLPHPDPRFEDLPNQLYNLDVVAYESLLLGLFSVWQGPSNKTCRELGIQKRNQVLLGFSRDGFHWHRPDRRPFTGADSTDGAWNWGNVQSAGGGCLVVGDQLYFYVSGRALNDEFWDGHCSTGLATLRRDGFASMDGGAEGGALTTRPLRFKGRHLMVNVDAAEGELRVEVLDRDGHAIEPFTREACVPIRVDRTLAPVRWEGADNLASLAGQAVRFRFHLRQGSLYSFWVSPGESAASQGYVAAGGPGLKGPIDTEGLEAYVAASDGRGGAKLAGGAKGPW